MALLKKKITRAQHRSHTRRVCECQLFLRSMLCDKYLKHDSREPVTSKKMTLGQVVPNFTGQVVSSKILRIFRWKLWVTLCNSKFMQLAPVYDNIKFFYEGSSETVVDDFSTFSKFSSTSTFIFSSFFSLIFSGRTSTGIDNDWYRIIGSEWVLRTARVFFFSFSSFWYFSVNKIRSVAISLLFLFFLWWIT